MMRELDYQARTLRILDEYLDELSKAKKRSDRAAELLAVEPDLGMDVPDFAKLAWKSMKDANALPSSRAHIPFSPRTDGIGRPVPNTVLKVPTGGGKTYLAMSALSKILGRYLGQNHGFVLWIVPNEAIYTQTKRHLTDRQHPYRQMLDRAAAGKVRILEKSDPLDARDVESQLCVMLLMLQSANRQTKDTLKMFQDRGDVHGFFPPEGDQQAHQVAMEVTSNLDAYDTSSGLGSMWPMVKDSLGNALRLIRPVVVMDEGHRAISDLAFDTLYGFNPCYVLELTATPKDVPARSGRSPRPARYANVLVEVTGKELDREGMIKMPLNLDARQGSDWKSTLAGSLGRLNALDRSAQQLRANTSRYIRPIMLVQVERTGDDQRDGAHIHALDVKDWLKTAGLDEAEIAIKTAATNDLNNPENQDLLSPTNRVRVIITKQALQEGWDCPFAYVLCSLSASSNLSGMTQLVGRILRQPHAEKTGQPELDECYVITHHSDTARVIGAIKQGLEEDGLGDLVKEIVVEDASNANRLVREIPRRDAFASTEIYLPLVLVKDNTTYRPLDYDADILFNLDWSNVDVSSLVARIPETFQPAENQMQRFSLSDAVEAPILTEATGRGAESLTFDPSYATRMVSDLVPNAWLSRELVGSVVAGLHQRGFTEEQLGGIAGLLVEELRMWLTEQQSTRAELLFREMVSTGDIQFRLRLDTNLNWSMPFTTQTAEPEDARQVFRNDGPLQRSLFSPVYEAEFNTDERDVAVYLDKEKALTWWHRNVARSQFSLQGWRREKIYPDFIFAIQKDDGAKRIAVLETKGDHLAGNDDTEYKRSVMKLMTEEFSWDTAKPSGTLVLNTGGTDEIVCELVLMSAWKTELPKVLGPSRNMNGASGRRAGRMN